MSISISSKIAWNKQRFIKIKPQIMEHINQTRAGGHHLSHPSNISNFFLILNRQLHILYLAPLSLKKLEGLWLVLELRFTNQVAAVVFAVVDSEPCNGRHFA